jgi:hypothetical protein
MADYIAMIRSNYFQVKDPEKFESFCKNYGLTLFRCEENEKMFYGFYAYESMPDYDAEKEEEIDFPRELSKHLAEGDVAIIQEIGYEKMRYFVGYAVAVNSKGKTVTVSLNEIYEHAKNLGNHISLCEY